MHVHILRSLCLFISWATISNALMAQDAVEFLNGTKLEGKLLKIRTQDKNFDFQSVIGGKEVKRTYDYSQVHAVVIRNKRHILTQKPTEQTAASSATIGLYPAGVTPRSRKEVTEKVEQAGRRLPSWYGTTQMNLPPKLDLSWPLKPKGQWNSSVNVGQFIWDRVNPNAGRWKQGIKLVHECMNKHAHSEALLQRDQQKLGTMYFTLLQDYEHAAYWLQKANSQPSTPSGVHLAECYWRLGNREMAMELLSSSRLHFDAIKLFGDMGELDQALRLAERFRKSNAINEAFLNAGDACRKAGKLELAINYYNDVLTNNAARNEQYKKRFRDRASGAIEAINLFEKADVSKVADGTYSDSSSAYNGKLDIEIRVGDGRIESLRVTNHKEKQYYAALTDTPNQIISKQSIRGIDGTSGATITSQAIVHATAKALAQGTRN